MKVKDLNKTAALCNKASTASTEVQARVLEQVQMISFGDILQAATQLSEFGGSNSCNQIKVLRQQIGRATDPKKNEWSGEKLTLKAPTKDQPLWTIRASKPSEVNTIKSISRSLNTISDLLDSFELDNGEAEGKLLAHGVTRQLAALLRVSISIKAKRVEKVSDDAPSEEAPTLSATAMVAQLSVH